MPCQHDVDDTPGESPINGDPQPSPIFPSKGKKQKKSANTGDGAGDSWKKQQPQQQQQQQQHVDDAPPPPPSAVVTSSTSTGGGDAGDAGDSGMQQQQHVDGDTPPPPPSAVVTSSTSTGGGDAGDGAGDNGQKPDNGLHVHYIDGYFVTPYLLTSPATLFFTTFFCFDLLFVQVLVS